MIEKFKSLLKDLDIVIISTLIAIGFILIYPFNQTPLRIIFALVLLLFLPGYVFITALFPRRDLDGFERFILSIGMSIAIIIFAGFAINYFQWEYSATSISIILLIIILFFVIIISINRRRIPYNEQYIFDFKSFIKSLKSEDKASYFDKSIISVLIPAIIFASGILIYHNLTTPDETFSSLYILGYDGKAENYQTNLRIGIPASIIVGVENFEHAPLNYTLKVKLNGELLRNFDFRLNHGSKWVQNVSFTPDRIGTNLKLEFLLYKEGSNEIYRSNHLWITSSIDPQNLDMLSHYVIKPPSKISNWNMENDNGWIFNRSGEFNGSYVDYISKSPTHSYQISLPLDKISSPGDYGEIYQNIKTERKGINMLSFNVKDSYELNEKPDFIFKQVLINNYLIWEDDINGDDGWQHVRVPVALNSGNNRLSLRLYKKNITDYSGIVGWWDDIQLETLTKMNISISNTNLHLGDLTKIIVNITYYEPNSTTFDFELKLNGQTVTTERFNLEGASNWTGEVLFKPNTIGTNLTLEGLLYREGSFEASSNQLLVSSFMDYRNIKKIKENYAITPPKVSNGDMESQTSWNFVGDNFNGTYTDIASVSSQHSYQISLPPKMSTQPGDFGAVYQFITASKTGIATLNFDVLDSHRFDTSSKEIHYKQVLINDKIVWEDDVFGDENWQHVEIPIGLNKGSNRLSLRLYEKQGVGNSKVDTWWDNIIIKTFEG